MRGKKVLLAALFAAMVLSLGIRPAMAYFTSYRSVRGGYELNLRRDTEIQERFSSKTKYVSVTNTGTVPVFVRLTAFWSSETDAAYVESEGWTLGEDGYCYYDTAILPGESTGEMRIHVELPEEAEAEDAFNVIVVYECTPVQYDRQGNAYADWSIRLQSGEGEEA